MNYFRTFLSLSVLTPGLVWTVFDARAQTCSQAPSCSELGYTKSVSDCAGQKLLYCPFDKSKVYCGGCDDCSAAGFTEDTSFCQALGINYLTCPSNTKKAFCSWYDARNLGCSTTKKYYDGTTCSSSKTNAIGCYNNKGIIMKEIFYHGGEYEDSLNRCISEGMVMASVSDYAALANCGLVTTTHKEMTFFARDISSGSSCVAFTDTSITPGTACSQSRYFLCVKYKF